MRLISIMVFVMVQVLFLPLTIIGLVLVTYKQLVISKKLGVSATAISAMGGRWIMNAYGTRRDVYTDRLYSALPNASALGLWLIFFPSYLRRKIHPVSTENGKEGVAEIPQTRTLHFDRLLQKSIHDVHQLVIMGAGYDTRCYGISSSTLQCFELDQEKTQKIKIDSLKKAGIDSSQVTFVGVDFATEEWYSKLMSAGFDPARRTLFLWEGVTPYLAESDIVKTVNDIKAHGLPGSVLLVDFYAERLMELQGARLTDERLRFGLDFSTDPDRALKSFLEKLNVKSEEYCFMGHKNKKGAWGVVVEVKL